MAEANTVTVQEPDSKQKSEFSITDCSICLEQLRNPKSLPCLHTFCQDCLSTFITSHGNSGDTPVFFNCPVCRRKTLPIEPSSSQDIWASQFPTNNFVIEMMKKINPEDTKKHICHPCLKRSNKEITASCWCQECGHYQCENCNQGHKLVLFDHKTISMEELSTHSAVLMPLIPLCEKHGEKQNLICTDHDILGCHTCIAIDHRRCDNVSTLKEYADSLKSNDKLSELAQDINTNVADIDFVLEEFRQKLNVVTMDKDTALKELSDVRKRFDSQMSRVSDEVMKIYKDEAEKIQTNLEDMETVRSSLLQTKAISNTMLQTGDEHQLVSTVLRGKSEIQRCQQIILNKQNDSIRISLKKKDVFEEMTREKQEICTVELSKKNLDAGKVLKANPLFGRTAQQIGSITVPGSGLNIRGLLALPNGNLLVSEWSNKQLLYITESGDVLSTLLFNQNPFDMCQISNGDFAVSMCYSKTVSVVRLTSSQLSLVRNIQLSEAHHAITYCHGALHVTTGRHQLCKVSDSGQLEHIQELKTTSYYLTCNKSGDQLIGSLEESIPTNAAVYRVLGDTIYTEVIKADIVKGARGIDVDDEGNIYVCGYQSNNVLQISADGSKTRELLTSNDLSMPFVIQLCGDKLFISKEYSGAVKIYKLE